MQNLLNGSNIKKVKYSPNKGIVEIHFFHHGGLSGDWEGTYKNVERPTDSFIRAMQDLEGIVTDVLEIGDSTITPIGISIFGSGDDSGCVITALKDGLNRSTAPACFNTPATAELDRNDWVLIDEVIKEALKYVNGERWTQTTLDFNQIP